VSEHDFEPIRGLPGALPQGETLLWQGAPDWWTMAQQAFHIRAVGLYFAGMSAWRAWQGLSRGESPMAVVQNLVLTAPVALAGLAILAFLAWLNSRTTVYTITNRRVVMRFGAAIPKAINIPFTVIEAAALKTLAGGAGDVALALKSPNKIAFLQLWPHARPWLFSSPQPTLRALAEAGSPAAILAKAIQNQPGVVLARAADPARDGAVRAGMAGATPHAA
jgi:hypothetical protein